MEMVKIFTLTQNIRRVCEEVRDRLLTDVALALPSDLEETLSQLKKAGCKRYYCRKKMDPNR